MNSSAGEAAACAGGTTAARSRATLCTRRASRQRRRRTVYRSERSARSSGWSGYPTHMTAPRARSSAQRHAGVADLGRRGALFFWLAEEEERRRRLKQNTRASRVEHHRLAAVTRGFQPPVYVWAGVPWVLGEWRYRAR
eukprot:CAMPEP_0181363854 /NCGR_PEP_ID=MMETSP1106-20121128/9001_1 /TAXON_ID=81844 /ORGANISM="Mantoniella antarctica, Strain SL-175" /LENGTH=138 /DNA_ID=CAMNT_0023478381 /DNA_START=199 /DNA_END=611 /DNA_ORIENTATION=+